MPTSAVMQARVPSDVQKAAKIVIEESGLRVSDVIRVLMVRIAQDKKLPLDLFQPNAVTQAAFAEIKRGNLPRYKNTEALFIDLNDENKGD